VSIVRVLTVISTIFITSNSAKVIENYNPPKIPSKKISEFLYIINKARSRYQDCGIYGVKPPAKPLKWNWKLYKAAYDIVMIWQ